MRTRLLALVGCVLVSSTLVRAAEPEAPKPGPEHEVLKKFVGDWNATVNMMGQEEKASATYTLGMGGFWLTETFTADFGGQKFEGRGTTGYDPIKKKYVATWIDSMTPSMMVMEGTYDKTANTLTDTGEGVGPDGKMQKLKDVSEFPDKDTIVFTMYAVVDGKDQQMMKITYKRKK